MNKKSTPFKLKGSPFKQTGIIGGAGGHNDPNGNPEETEYSLKNRKVNGLNVASGSSAASTGTEGGADDPIVVINEKTTGTTIANDGSIRYVTASQTGSSSSGNLLSGGSDSSYSGGGSFKNQAEKDWYDKTVAEDFGGDVQAYRNHYKIGKKTVKPTGGDNSGNSGTGGTNTSIAANDLKAYEFGTKGSSYESRKNVRTTKSNANTIYNQKMGKVRNNWRGGEKNEDGSRTIEGKSYKNRGEYVKSNKRKLDNSRRDSIIKTGESELKNSQNASSQNKTLGQKVRGKVNTISTANSAEEITAARNAAAAASTVDQVVLDTIDRNDPNVKTSKLKGAGFKMKGHSFGSKK